MVCHSSGHGELLPDYTAGGPSLGPQALDKLAGVGGAWGWEAKTPVSLPLSCCVTAGSHWPSLGLCGSCLT